MLRIVFTLDYEIHGNGEGCPRALMIEPTDRLLRLFDEYGAKLTIMADIAEILRFKAHSEAAGTDRFHYEAIAEQLRRAIATGHDVQLHLHSSYFNATIGDAGWTQDWSEYDLASLPYERVDWMIRTGKEYLESLLRPVRPDYRCRTFRAANWSLSPSRNIVMALANNGLDIETSVFKFGRRDGMVSFDYSHAEDALGAWPANVDDVCVADDSSNVWEVPIYSENRWIGAFLSVGRVHRAITGWPHKIAHRRTSSGSASSVDVGTERQPSTPRTRRGSALFRRHAWKADFNQCSGPQLVEALHRASRRYDSKPDVLRPFVLIGHSKLFTPRNEPAVRHFLEDSIRKSDRFSFGLLDTDVLTRRPQEAP
jgi:hypothetical protein